MAMLDVDEIHTYYGESHVLHGVSLTVGAGEGVALLGRNGAGKTTLMRIIAGVLAADAGEVAISGRDVTRLPTQARVRHGLAITHQIVRPFRSMTALENVALAAGHRLTANPLRALLRYERVNEEKRARTVLAQVGLAGEEEKPVTALPLGHLKRLEVARALAVDPILILLDEPLAGLNHREAASLADVIAAINGAGITIVLVEHNLGEVMRVCRRLLVLDQGRIIDDGAPGKVMANPAVRAAYLGTGQAHAAA